MSNINELMEMVDTIKTGGWSALRGVLGDVEAVLQLILTLKVIDLFGFKALFGLIYHSILNSRTASVVLCHNLQFRF